MSCRNAGLYPTYGKKAQLAAYAYALGMKEALGSNMD